MAVGLPISANDINSRVAAEIAALWTALRDLNETYQRITNADWDATFFTNLGYQPADVTLLKAAVADLGGPSGLWAVAHSQAHPAANNDFFFNARKLTGVNWAG
jgi:hypothetical protein